jgi:putative transposase
VIGTTKREMQRLEDIGVFEQDSDSEWAAPTFVQPKKTGDVRILTDFRKLNDCIKRKPFPLPKISELLQKLRRFKYATAIDLSMGYYHIPLDKASQKLCTTVLPWGKYRYLVLPMGIKNSPDIFQEVMTKMFVDLEYTSVYIDDILVISDGSFEDHLIKVQKVLQRLEQKGFRANLRKCFFAKPSVDYLGYHITRQGIQPQPKKVEAILKITAPKNVRSLRRFLGLVNYYRDMWKRRSHTLAPLTKLTGKGVKWEWKKEQEEAFQEIKRIMSKETILAYPDFTKDFHVYTDASNTQLGAVIMQDNKPLAFYSRKLNAAQKRYTTGEQELLSIVEALKEFRTLLWGQKVIVHTDHKNIIYGNLSNDRITRWRLLLEEYSPTFVHVKGIDNVVADALSRLEKESENEEQNKVQPQHIAYIMSKLDSDDNTIIPKANDAQEMAQCFASINDEIMERFPMHPSLIKRYQRTDAAIQRDKDNFNTTLVEGVTLYTRENKIVIPRALQQRIIAWYHLYLRHPGVTRMERTLSSIYWWPQLRKQIEAHVSSCPECQKNKKVRKKYGKIPPKEAEEAIPWNRVNIDLIGPLSAKTANGTFVLNALTMIDPATGWFEIAEIAERDSETVSKVFDDTWLSRYPRPEMIGFDNGSENKGLFTEMVDNYGMTKKPSTTYNPQSNGIIERVHLVLGDMLRTFELEERELDENNPWAEFLSAVAFAIRSTYHTTLEATPAQLVFGRDMILPISTQANWARIQQKRQEEIVRNNERENRTRVAHEYRVGDKVLLQKPGILRKLSSPRTGPHTILNVYNNGTVQIQRGVIREKVNIRRITPYIEQGEAE